jgi:hypothetical protein
MKILDRVLAASDNRGLRKVSRERSSIVQPLIGALRITPAESRPHQPGRKRPLLIFAGQILPDGAAFTFRRWDPFTQFQTGALVALRDWFLLTKSNTYCTIEMPSTRRSDGVRNDPGMPFGFLSE